MMQMNKYLLGGVLTAFICAAMSFPVRAQTIKILFDATKAQMAGNADWVIDADTHNLGYNSSGAMISGLGDESNPQALPTPAQSGITASTAETYWNGALSAWAVDCAKQGYTVETLPYNDSITYGNMTHTRDLSKYDVYIVDEPNILFTPAEKNAIVKFVQHGGGLFIISDHTNSDRNGDGYDSPYIWNDLFTTNTVQSNPFGTTFDLQDFSETSTNVANLPADSCLHGPKGNVSKIQYSNGTSMTLSTANNASVKGLIYKTGASNTGTTQVLFARSYYGSGKVCALGDSSPTDDGTGDSNDVLYNGYFGDASGQHQYLLMNATIWLATKPQVAAGLQDAIPEGPVTLYPNPAKGEVHLTCSCATSNLHYSWTDIYGRTTAQGEMQTNTGDMVLTVPDTGSGFYFLCIQGDSFSVVRRILVRE